ncbi:MAG TPA: Gfo/Idh/MocA family oxidoreductase [Edaphobacter sp.]
MAEIRVGIIGASANNGWAKASHVPAIRATPGMKLTAVGTSKAASAKAAAEAFGADHWFDDPKALVTSPDVDLVAVCVRVPSHRNLVIAALEAGKHVMCEWPLGRNVAEAKELASLAEQAGVHTSVGLQGRMNPAVTAAAEQLRSEQFGKPLTARIVSTTIGYAPEMGDAWAYLNDKSNGANLSTITGGHTFDLAIQLLGPIADIGALTTIQFPKVTLTDSGTVIDRNVPDHILASARYANGCVLSVELGGHRSPTPFSFEIVGTKGIVTLTGGNSSGFQAGDLFLTTSWGGEVSTPHSDPETVHAFNMTYLYQALAEDIHSGAHRVPDFGYAARLTSLLDDMLNAAAQDNRIANGDWPKP